MTITLFPRKCRKTVKKLSFCPKKTLDYPEPKCEEILEFAHLQSIAVVYFDPREQIFIFILEMKFRRS